MAQEQTQKNKKLIALLKDFESGNIEKQLEAIKALKVHGNETIIEPLVNELCLTKSNDLKAEIVDVLNNAKSTKVPEKLIYCLQQEKYKSVQQILLASIWNSNLDYRKYLAQIVQITLKGELLDALECLTIIENFEEIPSEESINEALVLLGNFLHENKNGSPKNDLLIEIGIVLKKMNDSL